MLYMNNYDTKAIAQRHITNLKKSANLLGSGSIKYEHILTKDQLINSYLQQMNELGYLLRKEVKRNRYVLTSDSLDEVINKAVNIAIEQIETEIQAFINNNVTQGITQATNEVLGTLNFNGQALQVKATNGHWETRLGRYLGRALANNLIYVLKDLLTGGTGRKRKRK